MLILAGKNGFGYGLVAQLVERLPLKEMVPGSSPGWPTRNIIQREFDVCY